MTNSATNSRDVHQADAPRRRFRPLAKATLATVVALLGVGFFASPAFAHNNTVTGVASCPVGATQTITWTIANDYNAPETATTFSSSAAGATFNVSSVTILASPTTTNESTGTVVETLPATATGTVSFTETANWASSPPYSSGPVTSNTSLASGCAVPNIGVTKSVSPSSVVAGSPTHVVYTLAVHNSGSLPTTTAVTVSDVIPAGLTYVAGTVSCGTTPSCTPAESNGTVTWSIAAPIYGGVTDDLTFAVTANAGDPSETIDNTGLFTGPGCTPKAPASTCSTLPVPLIVTNNAAVIVVKTASTGNVTAGQSTPVTYTVTVSNPSPPAYSTTTAGVSVSDVIPSGLTYVVGSVSCGLLSSTGTLTTPSCTATYSASSNTVTYLFGAGIAANASFPVTFQATVNAGDSSSITNTATWTGPGCSPTAPATSCSTSVTITVANVTVTKSDSAGSSLVNPGQVVTYTLAATNTGTGPGSITVNDAAPTGTTLSSPAPACPANTAGSCRVVVTGSSIAWTISSLAAGATDDLTFVVTVNAGTGGTHILNTGLYTEPGCTTAGGCSTNTTDNPVPPPTSPSTPTTTTTTTTSTSPVTKVSAGTTPTAISGASTVHTGEPWAGSTPYVLAALAFGISLLSLGTLVRRRRAARVPTA